MNIFGVGERRARQDGATMRGEYLGVKMEDGRKVSADLRTETRLTLFPIPTHSHQAQELELIVLTHVSQEYPISHLTAQLVLTGRSSSSNSQVTGISCRRLGVSLPNSNSWDNQPETWEKTWTGPQCHHGRRATTHCYQRCRTLYIGLPSFQVASSKRTSCYSLSL